MSTSSALCRITWRHSIEFGIPSPIVGRGFFKAPLEGPRKAGSVLIAHSMGDFLDAHVGLGQQFRRPRQSFLRQRSTEPYTCCALVKVLQMRVAEIKRQSPVMNRAERFSFDQIEKLAHARIQKWILG